MKKKLVFETGWSIQGNESGNISADIEDQLLVHLGRLIRGFKNGHVLDLLEKGKENYLKCEINVFVKE